MLSVGLHFGIDGAVAAIKYDMLKWGSRLVVAGAAGILYRLGATQIMMDTAGKFFSTTQPNATTNRKVDSQKRAIDFAELGTCIPGQEKVVVWSMANRGWTTCHPDGRITVRKRN